MNEAGMTEQAPTPSVESRVANALFGPPKTQAPPRQQAPVVIQQEPEAQAQEPGTEQSQEPTEAATGTEETQAPIAEETFDFEFDGEKFALPKKLERAVQNMRDYTQKTQGVSEQRKTAEHLMKRMQTDAMRVQFETQNAAELQQLAALDSVLENASKTINWAQMSTDEVLRQKIQIDQWKEQREAIARSVNGKYQQFEAAREKAVADLKAKAKELTSQRIPNWSEAVQKAVHEHALTEGYTEAELAQAELDPRHNVTLWKAQQFDALKAKATPAVTQVKSVKTTSSNPMPQAVKDKLAFNKAMKATAPGSPEQKRLVEQRVGSLFSKR